MDADQRLLFGALALQTGLIDSQQFAESYRDSGAQPQKSMQDVLVERKWLSPADAPHIEYLKQRVLAKHHGDAKAVLSDLPLIIRQSLAALRNVDSEATIAGSDPAPDLDVACVEMEATTTEARYALKKLHASGGIGRVWLARDGLLDREVALKELRPEAAGSAKRTARFLREARLTAQLAHPGIVPVYELGLRPETRQPYYTMRFVRGRTLSSAINDWHAARAEGRADPLEFAALLTAFATVCNTVAYAHSCGVLHRDLKGDNVILGDFGEAILLDWGLAKLMGDPDDEVDPFHDESGHHDPAITTQGEIMGTPSFMSPEQAEGRLQQVDHRTDIYGLGAMLYAILTGAPPFPGTNTKEVLQKVVRGHPAPPHEIWPEVPAALEAACLKAMARDPQKRYSDAAELAQKVQSWQDVQRRRAEDALRRQTELLSSILNSIPGIVWTARPDGAIDYANRFWLQFTGLTMQQTVGTGWASAVHPEDIERVTQVWTAALSAGQPVEIDYRVRRAADGAYRRFLAQGRPVYDSKGTLIKWFGLLTEIEDAFDRKRTASELQQANPRRTTEQI